MWNQNILRISLVLGLFAIWEWVGSYSQLHVFLLPSPSSIWLRFIERPERFFWHAGITLKEMFGGISLAFSAAFPLAWLMFRWRTIGSLLQPFFVLIQCIPMFVLAPLMVFWFGWSYIAIVIPTALMIFFPLTIALYQGLQSTPAHLLDFFRIHQATQWQVFTKLQLPWALPHILSGLKISTSIAGIGAVAGEWAGAQEGLGVLMMESRRSTDIQTLFSALFCLAAISIALYSFILMLEKKWIFRMAKNGLMMLAMLALILCGCSGKNESKDIRLLLDWLPNPNHVPIYAGIEGEIFKKHGLDLRILKIRDPSDGIPYLTSGQADISLFYTTETIRANRRGAHLQPIGILIDRPLNSILFRKDRGINQPSDLNGKVIGYCSDGSGSLMLEHLLQIYGVKPGRMLNVSFDLVGSLGLGHVDAVFGAFWNIEGEHLRSLGVDTGHYDVSQLGYPSYNELIFITREGFASATPGFAEAFQNALRESIQFSVENPEAAFQLYAEANPDKSNQTLAWEKKAWEVTIPLLAQNQEIRQEDWTNLAAWLETKGYFK